MRQYANPQGPNPHIYKGVDVDYTDYTLTKSLAGTLRPPCGNQMVTVKRQRDGRIENRRLMDEVEKLQKTTLLRSDEAAEPLESNQCLWLARR